MSLMGDIETNNCEEHKHPTVDDEAYEPTYAEAFPPLRMTGLETVEIFQEPSAPIGHWGTNHSKMAVRSSVITQVFSVPVEERRFKEISEQQFGGRNQVKICQDIMSRTGVAIEMSLAKDESLTVVITGKQESVKMARKLIIQQLQTQGQATVKIPKDHHRFILGPKGKHLSELELATATKISIPRQEDPSDIITITGTKDGIEKARHEIQLISDEQAKLAFVRLPIPKVYHPFICGPFNQYIKELMEQTKTRINVPPQSVMKDELTIAGEKDGVHIAEQAINRIYETKRRTCTTVSVEVKKSQHKYVLGTRGQNLNEILAETGVSVELPPPDVNSDTITLRGEADKLGLALTAVYAKANSVMVEEICVESWLHRFIIGPKGANIKQITQDFPKVRIDFYDEQNKIVVEGPPEELAKVVAKINEQKLELMSRMAFVDLKVDPKYHGHIIGRSGANVNRIKNETGVSIRIPPDNVNNSIIRIEGTPEGVACAKQQLIEMVEKMDNEKTRDILIDHRYHKAIIGTQGTNIREIRERFNDVQISFPDPSKQSDVVTLRGPKAEVDKCYKHLHQLAQDMAANNYEEKIRVFKDVHPKIIGKGGAQIKKIREETDTKIEFPRENSDSDVITITGRKENVEKARIMIEAIEKETINIKEITVEVPHKLHTSMIGTKGHLIREIMVDCGGVQIRFPGENTTSDKVFIRGPKDEVEKAKKRLLDLANERKEAGFTAEIRAKPEYHGFLIGRGGASIRDFRERTDTRIVFPTANDADQELITIIGKKENVEKAVKELEERIAGLANTVEKEIRVDPRHHGHFVARRGEVLRQITDDFGGVTVSFPRMASKSDRVVLKGAKDCVEGACKRITDVVADLEARVTIECVIPRKHHGSIMGPKGQRIQDISRQHNVTIKIPERSAEERGQQSQPTADVNGHLPNGDSSCSSDISSPNGDSEMTLPALSASVDSSSDADQIVSDSSKSSPDVKRDIILVSGRKENCEAARDAMMALIPITEEINVPFDFHGQLIGQKGKEIRQLMDECEVIINVPRPDDHSDVIKITGPPSKLAHAREVIERKVHQLEEERRQRELRSFRLEVEVPSKHHTKLIGRGGAVVNKLRTDYDVQVIFPRPGDKPDIITVIGLEEKANAARDEILKKAQELDELMSVEVHIDHRVHPRLIGARGRAISRIMEDFRVDIRMPGREAEDPDLVVITGREDDVYDCRDHLLNLEEEYVQDIVETPSYSGANQGYSDSRGQSQGGSGGAQMSKGFIVRDAPWSQSYTYSDENFPDLGAAAPSASTSAAPTISGPPPSTSRPVWPIRK
jgi:polyribonucleotide nucleotidyltransferase